MARKKWINTHKVGSQKYWYCPGKCGRPHVINTKEVGDYTCRTCGFSYIIHDIQGPRVLIEEVKDETQI